MRPLPFLDTPEFGLEMEFFLEQIGLSLQACQIESCAFGSADHEDGFMARDLYVDTAHALGVLGFKFFRDTQ